MVMFTSYRTAIVTTMMLLITLTSMLPPMGARAAEKKDGPKVLGIQRIEKADVLEETRIERETLQGGYVCFKAFRRDSEVHLTEKDLAALHVRPTDPAVTTKTTVSRWALVSISCIKQ